MKTIKKIFSQLLIYCTWIIISTLVWSWLFNIATDTSAQKKITVFVEAEEVSDNAFAVYLESVMPEKLKMVKVHPFSYAMFDEYTLTHADIYIVKADEAEKYIESFAPIENREDGKEYFEYDGKTYGIKIYDAATGRGSEKEYITYSDCDYYLFYGVNSVHIGEINGSDDEYAFDAAGEIFKLN